MADSLSIEEINKIRIAAGAAPLPVAETGSSGPVFKEQSSSEDSDDEPASTLTTREAAAGENWQKLQDDATARRRREEAAAKIRKARDQAKKFAKLEGKGLGDESDEGEVDMKAWLKSQKKRQRQLERERARKKDEELAEMERLAQVQYGAEDLAGVKVGHEATAFEDLDGEQILTLKDTLIDGQEDEEDELENTSLREQETLKEKLRLKKRKPAYDPNAMDEDGNRKVLSQYDEEIEGKKRKRFTLGEMGGTAEQREAKRLEIGERLRSLPITLDIVKETPQSDYMEISEVKMKKPKNKKKSTRRRAEDDEDIFPTNGDTNDASNGAEAMEVDGQATQPTSTSKNTSFVDDDDLQASLTAQRRATLKKRKRQRPEDIARELREETSATPGELTGYGENGFEEGRGLVIDETSEFVANLQRPVTQEEKVPRRSVQPSIETPDDDGDIEMKADVPIEGPLDGEEADKNPRTKREHSDAPPDVPSTGIEDEASVGQGLGATLKLLRERGLIESKDSGGRDSSAVQRERNEFLAVKNRVEAEADTFARQQRERDRASGRLDRMSVREREDYARSQNQQRDLRVQRELAALFEKEYRPDVRLSYVDEHGRRMNQKEAFKELSHQFHGKGSGAGKTEKRLKKIDDEKRIQSKSVLDSSEQSGYGNVQGTMTRRNRQAGVRLA